MVEQKSAEWFAQRAGKVTASRIKDVMSKTKSGYGASRTNYMMELLCQRLTGKVEEGFSNAVMQRGTDMEPMARGVYEGTKEVLVEESGFVQHPHIPSAGASPDGLVGTDGLIEIKCPNTATHIEFLRTGDVETCYLYQMQFQMLCTGRKWCDFVSYDDRLPEELQYKCVRIHHDDAVAKTITMEVEKFLHELDVLEAEMRGMIQLSSP